MSAARVTGAAAGATAALDASARAADRRDGAAALRHSPSVGPGTYDGPGAKATAGGGERAAQRATAPEHSTSGNATGASA